jgi:hypothetical protein
MHGLRLRVLDLTARAIATIVVENDGTRARGRGPLVERADNLAHG